MHFLLLHAICYANQTKKHVNYNELGWRGFRVIVVTISRAKLLHDLELFQKLAVKWWAAPQPECHLPLPGLPCSLKLKILHFNPIQDFPSGATTWSI